MALEKSVLQADFQFTGIPRPGVEESEVNNLIPLFEKVPFSILEAGYIVETGVIGGNRENENTSQSLLLFRGH